MRDKVICLHRKCREGRDKVPTKFRRDGDDRLDNVDLNTNTFGRVCCCQGTNTTGITRVTG